jgi:hypothetical protein
VGNKFVYGEYKEAEKQEKNNDVFDESMDTLFALNSIRIVAVTNVVAVVDIPVLHK